MMISIVDNGDDMEGRGSEVIARISTYWNIAPRLLIIFLMAFGFLRVLKKEGVSYER